MKRIFYFNITYTCNSNCVFCYSHNTIHSGRLYNEIELKQFVKYLRKYKVGINDRVVINGGEPFLHSNIIEILKSLKDFCCETLIYTNGRLLYRYNLDFLDKNYRFIIPIHGYRELHDTITRSLGSHADMVKSFYYIKTLNCLIDVKVIINNFMANSNIEMGKTLKFLDSLPINHAIHITKMADTIVSQKNHCSSITQEQAARCTCKIFEHIKNKEFKIKLFDTCVKDIAFETRFCDSECSEVKVYFKDNANEWEFECYTPRQECRDSCMQAELCISAVGNYNVLEYHNGKLYKGLE